METAPEIASDLKKAQIICVIGIAPFFQFAFAS